MQIPKQSEPIMRTIPAQPFASLHAGDGAGGLTPNEHGVQPNIIPVPTFVRNAMHGFIDFFFS